MIRLTKSSTTRERERKGDRELNELTNCCLLALLWWLTHELMQGQQQQKNKCGSERAAANKEWNEITNDPTLLALLLLFCLLCVPVLFSFYFCCVCVYITYPHECASEAKTEAAAAAVEHEQSKANKQLIEPDRWMFPWWPLLRSPYVCASVCSVERQCRPLLN